jgi:hypothetical protein
VIYRQPPTLDQNVQRFRQHAPAFAALGATQVVVLDHDLALFQIDVAHIEQRINLLAGIRLHQRAFELRRSDVRHRIVAAQLF